MSISFVSCTNDAIEENTSKSNISSHHDEMLLNQKPGDTTGGQGGNIPPTKP